MLELSDGLQGLFPPASEGVHQKFPESVQTLLVARRICFGRETSMGALRQHGMSGEGQMKCKACHRDAEVDFCLYHAAAKTKLEATYPRWVRAFGGMEWKEYLDNVKRDPQTGQWAKEVARLLGETG